MEVLETLDLKQLRGLDRLTKDVQYYRDILTHFKIKRELAIEKVSVCNVENVSIEQIIDFYFKEKYKIE